jgi:hypothetical protein
MADAATGTYAVEIALPDAVTSRAGWWAGGDSAQATAGRALIPIEALLEADGDHGVVYVLSEDGSKAVQAGYGGGVQSDRVVVTRGLENARLVVTDGAAYLRDGVKAVAVMSFRSATFSSRSWYSPCWRRSVPPPGWPFPRAKTRRWTSPRSPSSRSTRRQLADLERLVSGMWKERLARWTTLEQILKSHRERRRHG